MAKDMIDNPVISASYDRYAEIHHASRDGPEDSAKQHAYNWGYNEGYSFGHNRGFFSGMGWGVALCAGLAFAGAAYYMTHHNNLEKAVQTPPMIQRLR